MKKVLSVLLVALLIAGVAYAAPSSPGAGDIVAKHGTMATPDKTFRLVRFMPPSRTGNSASLTKDSVVIWDTTSKDGVTITTSTTSGDCRVAGIAAVTFLTPEVLGRTASDELGGRNWGWIQTYGLTNMRCGAKGIAANFAMGVGPTEGCIVTMESVGQQPTPQNWTTAGFTMQKQETDGVSTVGFIRCQ